MRLFLVYIDNPDGDDWVAHYDITESAIVLAQDEAEAIFMITHPPTRLEHFENLPDKDEAYLEYQDGEGKIVISYPIVIDPDVKWKAMELTIVPSILHTHMHYG